MPERRAKYCYCMQKCIKNEVFKQISFFPYLPAIPDIVINYNNFIFIKFCKINKYTFFTTYMGHWFNLETNILNGRMSRPRK